LISSDNKKRMRKSYLKIRFRLRRKTSRSSSNLRGSRISKTKSLSESKLSLREKKGNWRLMISRMLT